MNRFSSPDPRALDESSPADPVDPAAILTLATLRGITAPILDRGGDVRGWTVQGLVLNSDGINAKHGFGDGDCPDPILAMVCEWFNDDWVTIDSEVWHPVLFDLVRTRLLPAIGAPDLPVFMMEGYHHNPIRIDADPKDVSVPAGTVTVDWLDLFARVVAATPTRRILTDAEREAQEYGGF